MYQVGMFALRNDQIDCLCSDKFDVGARGIEMCVVGDYIARFAHDAEQNPFRRATLMSRDHVAIAKYLLNGTPEVIVALAAGIALIPFHDRGPLSCGHRART